MPRRDGTGPLGHGAATGRGLGRCGAGGAAYAAAPRCGRGFGRGYCGRTADQGWGYGGTRESLAAQKAELESRLEEIKRLLD